MKFLYRITLILLLFLFPSHSILARQTDSTATEKVRPKLKFGYDGGMMLHTGYLKGEIPQLNYLAKGLPYGIGGAIKFHLGPHFRVGSEGYVSYLKQMGNGSEIKYGWGGILADYRYEIGRFMPYVGLTLGGGARTSSLMFEGDVSDWEPEKNVVLHKQRFFAVAPFVGCDFIVTPKFHLTLKCDWLNAIHSGKLVMPTGPRIYFGFLMYH